jgi:ribonucleotide reductase, class II
VVERNVEGLRSLDVLWEEELDLIKEQQLKLHSLASGRWMWVGGTKWMEQPENFYGAYNCTSTVISDLESLSLLVGLAMMGCGTGAVLELDMVQLLPPISARLEVEIEHYPGHEPAEARWDTSHLSWKDMRTAYLVVGDSRDGWVDAYYYMLHLATIETGDIKVLIDLGSVRPTGETLKGFGGVSNPIKLPELFIRMAEIMNGAYARNLTPLEVCLLIDEAASVVVAGNIRRTAGMRQFSVEDTEARGAKLNLWSQDETGSWHIDPKKDALRMANHTNVYHTWLTKQEVEDAVRTQFHTGEGAIQFAPEAIARANRDLLPSREFVDEFISQYCRSPLDGAEYLFQRAVSEDIEITEEEENHRLSRYGLNPCGEIIGSDFMCNLAEVHLNTLVDKSDEEVDKAFKAAALTAAALLVHEFDEPRYAVSRNLDPIVGVSFTGLFDFFVHKFGVEWLEWWALGRPANGCMNFSSEEATYLSHWKNLVHKTVEDFCEANELNAPNRCTTVQPAGTKSLLTGASPGWHPPKAQRFIRRITFGKDNPIALACMDYGYTIVPSQSDKDENGRLLDDPFDPRCTEWLVEIPTEVSWANLPGADKIDISKFSAIAQLDFYMQVQTYYTTHNTSATIELREDEIEPLADAIFNEIGQGYISAALLARFDANETFPRMPFEPISKERYEELQAQVKRRRISEFDEALAEADNSVYTTSGEPEGPAGCDSDKCLFPVSKS